MRTRTKLLHLSACLVAVALLPVLAYAIQQAREPAFAALIEKKGEPVRELLKDPTLYRRTKLKNLPCSVEEFDFLLDRPRTSMALAGKLHKSLDKYDIEPRGTGSLHIEDSKSLVGDMELFSHTPGERLYYVTGYWRLMPGITLEGRMALVVEYQERYSLDGKSMEAKARGYMVVDNTPAGLAFKLFVGLFPSKVDKRIERFATAVRKVVVAVHEDPEAALERLEDSPLVPEKEVEEFRERFVGKGSAYVLPRLFQPK